MYKGSPPMPRAAAYDSGCDRMAISSDGKTIYSPSFKGPDWKVVDAHTGDETARITAKSGAHNNHLLAGRPARLSRGASLSVPFGCRP